MTNSPEQIAIPRSWVETGEVVKGPQRAAEAKTTGDVVYRAVFTPGARPNSLDGSTDAPRNIRSGFNLLEVRPTVELGSAISPVEALKGDVQELRSSTQAEIAALREQVSALTRTVSQFAHTAAIPPEAPAIFGDALSAATVDALSALVQSDECWADLFSFVADNGAGTSAIAQCSLVALSSTDPMVRAAAARAAASLCGPDAIVPLKEMLAIEGNSGVRAIVTGALEAARL